MHERVTLGLARSYQITNIFTRLTVLDNVAMAVQSRVRDWGTSFSFELLFVGGFGDHRRRHALLAQVSLPGMANRLAGQLSHENNAAWKWRWPAGLAEAPVAR